MTGRNDTCVMSLIDRNEGAPGALHFVYKYIIYGLPDSMHDAGMRIPHADDMHDLEPPSEFILSVYPGTYIAPKIRVAPNPQDLTERMPNELHSGIFVFFR